MMIWEGEYLIPRAMARYAAISPPQFQLATRVRIDGWRAQFLRERRMSEFWREFGGDGFLARARPSGKSPAPR
jgi:hypothetical protein